MRISHLIAPLTAAAMSALPLGQAAYAELLIKVDKSAQHMTVTVNGEQLYNWPVTTGGSGYDTPSGTFKPFRMEVDHYSDEYDNAPMPYSIFFTQTGNAIHGTNEQRNLGRPVSHGCVWLSVKNAAALWELVKQQKMANTTVVLTGAIRDAGPPAVARSRPMPLTPEEPLDAAPVPLAADNPSYGAPSPQYQRRYGDDPLPVLFPF
ncbi:MAG: L,D-transpeptidase, partial [Pseudolabrys sp.]